MSTGEDNTPPAPSSYQDGNSARLYAFIARDAAKAVVLRRGSTRQTLMLTWDMETDTFQEGQWFIGRIYERLCDLSHFVYFGAKHRGGGGEDLLIEHARMTRDGWTFENKDLKADIPRNHVPAPDEDGIHFRWKIEGAHHPLMSDTT